jgi:hypothetical protein
VPMHVVVDGEIGILGPVGKVKPQRNRSRGGA